MGLHIGPDGVCDGQIVVIGRDANKDLDHEIIERKGIGHPDTICDVLAARFSRDYAKYTMANCDGLVLHHQFDKVMIIGGKTDVTWGYGHFIEPVILNIAGRITVSYKNKRLPIDDLIGETVKNYFGENFPLLNLKTDLIVNNFLTTSAGPGTIRESTGAIKEMFNPTTEEVVRGYEKLVANDTSYCVAYAPYSLLESTVLEIEGHLNSVTTKKQYPWMGTDIKIMAVRYLETIDITACIPQIAKYVCSLEEYKLNLEIVAQETMNILLKYYEVQNIHLSVNTKDDYEKKNVYLTVTGASLSGDIGVVGRGNRPNGLITANRPMSMEGTNGKNPRYYSGFIYALLSRRIANRLYAEIQKPCEVKIVSQNGGLLLKPWRTFIITDFNDYESIRRIVEQEFVKIPTITDEFVKGEIVAW